MGFLLNAAYNIWRVIRRDIIVCGFCAHMNFYFHYFRGRLSFQDFHQVICAGLIGFSNIFEI